MRWLLTIVLAAGTGFIPMELPDPPDPDVESLIEDMLERPEIDDPCTATMSAKDFPCWQTGRAKI